MALSVEKLLNDAHTLIVHLKDHDSLADSMISTTQVLYNKYEAMKQYQDDITELNEIAKHRPRSTLVLGIAQENRQIRQLQQENNELQATLEEHQSALEIIMHKYREHTMKLLQGNRMERALQSRDTASKDPSVCQLMDKIQEMAGVMQKAVEVDEASGCVDQERLSQLELENKALREMLEICSTGKERILPQEETKVSKEDINEEEDEEEDTTDTELDSTILTAPDKPVLAEVEDKDLKTEKDKGQEKEKEKEKPKVVDEKKKKKSPDVGRKTASAPTKPVGASKSTGDVRKGRTTPTGKTEGATGSTVKKSLSSTILRKDTTTVRKSPSTDTKKDLKGKIQTKLGSGSTAKK